MRVSAVTCARLRSANLPSSLAWSRAPSLVLQAERLPLLVGVKPPQSQQIAGREKPVIPGDRPAVVIERHSPQCERLKRLSLCGEREREGRTGRKPADADCLVLGTQRPVNFRCLVHPVSPIRDLRSPAVACDDRYEYGESSPVEQLGDEAHLEGGARQAVENQGRVSPAGQVNGSVIVHLG